MTRVIKAALFDLDGTLYDRDAVAAVLIAAQYDAFAPELRGIARERFLREVHAIDDHGHGDKEAGFRALVRQWGLEPTLAARLIAYFWEHYDRHCRLPDDVLPTLATLRARGLKLGVITNGASEHQRPKLVALGIAEQFDTILVSGEEGVRKPDAEIFARALARCGVAAHEAVFVGDHPVADVRGAHDAGLVPVWKYVPYWRPVVPSAAVVRRIAEVPAICFGAGDRAGAAGAPERP